MKHTFKKVAAILLVALMCVSTMMPAFAADIKCPGKDRAHDKNNCTYVKVSEQKATCEGKGIVIAKCSNCEEIFSIESDVLGHKWNTAKPATCNSPSTQTCRNCNKTITIGSKLEHSYSAYTVTGGVCKVGERISRTCRKCNSVDEKIIGDEGHAFNLKSYDEPKNCVTDGKATYTCMVSGCKVTKVVPIKDSIGNHNYISYEEWVAKKTEENSNFSSKGDNNYRKPTCAVSGRASIVCEYCDDVKIISLGKSEHTKSALQPAKDPTCTTTGTGLEAHYYCIDCRNVYFDADGNEIEYSDLIIPANHDPRMMTIGEEVSPTCTSSGYRVMSCKKCTYNKREILNKYSKHLYYASVTEKEDKINVLKVLGLYTNEDDVETIWKQLGKVDFNQPGQNKVWKNYVPATCTTNAKVTWICLNCTFNLKEDKLVYANCTVGSTVTPSGDEYKKTGHKFVDEAGCYEDKVEPTCTLKGTRVYTCVNEHYDASGSNLVPCTKTDTKPIEKLDHKWEERVVAVVNGVLTYTQKLTCRQDGIQCYVCVRCDSTKKEQIKSKGNEHQWQCLDNYSDAIANIKCEQKIEVEGYCTETDCPYNREAQKYTEKGPSHEYYDVTDADKLEAIKELGKDGKIPTENGKTIVECTEPGGCETYATYKLTCINNDCAMFKTFEIKEGYKQGHEKTLISNSALAATCEENGGSIQWYCSNKGCPHYAEDATNVPNPGRDTVYVANHYLWDAAAENYRRPVGYKDVPDARICNAASYDAAKLIEAPKDSKGNVIRAISIQGTSLVWVYKYTDENHPNETVTYGGIYCADCKNYQGENSIGQAPTLTVEHSYTAEEPVAATCQSYGYTLYKCACGDSYQADYRKISTHTYPLIDADDKEAAWENLSDEEKELRSYKAPRCLAKGEVIDLCEVCGFISTKIIPAIGHKNVDDEPLTTSCKDEPTDRLCVGCNEFIPKVHVSGTGNVCKICGGDASTN